MLLKSCPALVHFILDDTDAIFTSSTFVRGLCQLSNDNSGAVRLSMFSA